MNDAYELLLRLDALLGRAEWARGGHTRQTRSGMVRELDTVGALSVMADLLGAMEDGRPLDQKTVEAVQSIIDGTEWHALKPSEKAPGRAGRSNMKKNIATDNRREAALQALMECTTLTEAAKRAGIGRTTLWTYLQDREFCEALQAMREQAIIERAAALADVRRQAIDTLADVMREGMPPQERIKAAKIALDHADAAFDAAAEVMKAPIQRYNGTAWLKGDSEV